MQEIKIESVTELVSHLEANKNIRAIFRGVSNCEHELIPSLGRKYNNGDINTKETRDFILIEEQNMMRMFRTESFQFHKDTSLPELELMAMAQHHGLKTRLLDWTRGGLVALYFACISDFDKDGCVYMFTNDRPSPLQWLDGRRILEVDPYKLDKSFFFTPLHSTPRITAQQGILLVFKDPFQEFKHSQLVKFIIPSTAKEYAIDVLSMLGITPSTIFPDLEGTAKWINWRKFGA